ncbi:unnamed protein product [Larinioides sclopetarius]|uniref:Secreted protein n=1 Tax=Larinioides sclopetarius TaxID=280406 RepID=A0AAV2BNQ5_9ARAC
MLLYAFLVLGVWNGVLGSDDLCDEPEYRVCEMPDGIQFPETEEDINRLCPIFIQNIDCLKDYFDKCGYERGLTEDKLQKLKEVTEDGCREDSPLHLGLVRNIGCFSEVIENDEESCKRYISSKASKMRNYLYDIETENGYSEEERYDPELWMPFQCILDSFEIACFISKVSERCGSDARDIASEVLTRALIVHNSCAASNEERISELLTLLELELEEEATLRRIIKKE